MTKVCRATALITGNSAKLFRKAVRQAWNGTDSALSWQGPRCRSTVTGHGRRRTASHHRGEGGHLGDGGDPQVVQARVRPAARAGPGRGSGDRAGARYVAEFVEMMVELLHSGGRT